MYIIQADSTKQAWISKVDSHSTYKKYSDQSKHTPRSITLIYHAHHRPHPYYESTISTSRGHTQGSDHMAEDTVQQRGFDQPVVLAQGLARGGGVGGEEPQQQ